ncbi:histidinol-phosphate transaminase domain protein [Mycobacterium xenopi 4042]|uniref:Histidinol-phosphate transaminase domain protein n=1 Tax=Mycobacterium xenopi 4042 TaxID=1299334 RepID=X8DE12_MYCXE|nr:histidinol-phosphate transaminase domain protein [Mycobacterium xenopi 4042]
MPRSGTPPRRRLLFDPVMRLDPGRLTAARYHGDQAAAPGMLDFAVNVRHRQPPAWLVQRLAGRLADLARYPSRSDEAAAADAVAARHGRAPPRWRCWPARPKVSRCWTTCARPGWR